MYLIQLKIGLNLPMDFKTNLSQDSAIVLAIDGITRLQVQFMTFSQDVWQRNLDLYQKILALPFNQELANGTLDS